MSNAQTSRNCASFWRHRSHMLEAAFAAAVLLVALGCFLALNATAAPSSEEEPIAVISQDGTEVARIRLQAVEKPYDLNFQNEHGENVVRVEPGRIRVAQADCPDKVCVNAGWIDGPGTPIACVPHGLTIVIEQEAAHGVDATAR